ncbi:MAG: hypothetical protein KDA52_19835 [Planctomycetaceae bacterium]|nr:hypothetical protein [Planctomycetaceae bacterium]
MNQSIFLRKQAIQLRQLLDDAENDPVLKPQLQQRLDDVESELKQLETTDQTLFPVEAAELPRVALFLSGRGVEGQTGIRPSLAGESLIQYEKMFLGQALHDERAEAKAAGRQRRPRGASEPELLFTGTPRGSFGLELTPRPADEAKLTEIHSRSLRHVSRTLANVADSDISLEEAVRDVPPSVLQPMKKFFKVLASYGAQLRLASSEAPPLTVSVESIEAASQRLEKELIEEEIRLEGTFRGLTRETLHFDLIVHDGDVISGTVAESLTEEDLERIDNLTNESCIAELLKSTLQPVTGNPTVTYVLLNARPAIVTSESN